MPVEQMPSAHYAKTWGEDCWQGQVNDHSRSAGRGVGAVAVRPDSNRRGERHSVIRLQGHLDPMPLPKSSTMMLRHEPTLIATTGYQMTASSPRGTFSQAELTADRVITRCITRSAVSSL
jgi:hypothetical protein